MKERAGLCRVISSSLALMMAISSSSCTPREMSGALQSMDERGRLGVSFFWGKNFDTHEDWLAQDMSSVAANAKSFPPLGKQLRSMLQACEHFDGTHWFPLKSLHFEGQLTSSDAYKESQNSIANFEKMYSFALCSILDPGRQADFRSKALAGIMAWVCSYQPSGNPIDERSFLPMFLAVDLLEPAFSSREREKTISWLDKFDIAQVRAEASWRQPVQMGPSKIFFGRKLNNWKTWHLVNRVTLNKVLGRDAAVKDVGSALDLLASQQILNDGSTLDFLVRHGLHYQLNTIEAYLRVLLVDPALLSESTLKRIKLAIEFVRPYYLGEKKNVEFSGSLVPFDETRANAGEAHFVHSEWKPERAARILRMARVVFPEVRVWTSSAITIEPSTFLDSWLTIHDFNAL